MDVVYPTPSRRTARPIDQSDSVTTPTVDGSLLARFHAEGDAPDDGIRLVDYAESPRVDHWSLRGALVRYAQPEPVRASALLELVRRTDGALKPFARDLERELAPTDPRLVAASFSPEGFTPSPEVRLDIRAADLARLAVDAADDLDAIIAGYEEVAPLRGEERSAIPLLAVAVELDRLGEVLAEWAADRRTPRPDAQVDEVSRRTFVALGALGVARETRPPRRSGA
jgi:hypothetical protein